MNIYMYNQKKRLFEEYPPRGECPIKGILHMDDIKSTDMLFTVGDDASTTHIAPAGDHDDIPGVKVYKIGYLALFKIEFDSVINFYCWIRVANGAAIMSYDEGNTLGAQGYPTDLEEFVGSLLLSDTMDGKAAFHVIQKTEVLSGFLNGNRV